MKINYEVIEESIGEGDYRLVQKGCIEVMEDASLFGIGRQVKKEIGWTGRHCRVTTYENGQEIRLYGAQMVARFEVPSYPTVGSNMESSRPHVIRLQSSSLKKIDGL